MQVLGMCNHMSHIIAIYVFLHVNLYFLLYVSKHQNVILNMDEFIAVAYLLVKHSIFSKVIISHSLCHALLLFLLSLWYRFPAGTHSGILSPDEGTAHRMQPGHITYLTQQAWNPSGADDGHPRDCPFQPALPSVKRLVHDPGTGRSKAWGCSLRNMEASVMLGSVAVSSLAACKKAEQGVSSGSFSASPPKNTAGGWRPVPVGFATASPCSKKRCSQWSRWPARPGCLFCHVSCSPRAVPSIPHSFLRLDTEAASCVTA